MLFLNLMLGMGQQTDLFGTFCTQMMASWLDIEKRWGSPLHETHDCIEAYFYMGFVTLKPLSVYLHSVFFCLHFTDFANILEWNTWEEAVNQKSESDGAQPSSFHCSCIQHNRLELNVPTMGSVCLQLWNQLNICELAGNGSVRDVLLLRYI